LAISLGSNYQKIRKGGRPMNILCVRERKCRFPVFLSVLALVVLIIPNVFAATNIITIDGNDNGRIFDGIGMVNSSGTSKLLMDYPPEQQQEILDFLFKPNFGAGLTVIKNEIGGDMNSSSGTEPCHQRLETETPTARGVNFWICRKAKERNPAMRYAAGRWGIPAWANASDGKKKDYYLSYLRLMAENGTPLDYLSPEENEGTFNRDYVVNTLKPALNAAGFSGVKLVPRDAYQSWGIADTLASDPALKNIVYAVNNHYVTTSTTTALQCGLPLFNDESDTPFRQIWSRMMFVAINNAKQYVDGKMVRVMYQPALDCVYDSLKYNYKGILTANTPWSGYYEVHPSLWMTAHYTQFAKPGWKFLDNACGKRDENNYYLALRNPGSNDYSVIIVNSSSTATDYTFKISGGLSEGAVHVWRTTQTEQFVRQADITPSGGIFALSIPAQSVYSLTTTAGQQKGIPAHSVPEDTALRLPYTDDFSGYSAGAQPRFTHDQSGAFEVAEISGNPCLRQSVNPAPVEWGGGTSSRQPYTVFGDLHWVNYQVSADVRLGGSGASALISGRGNLHNRDSGNPATGYQMQLFASGNWYFRKLVFGAITDFTRGTISGFNPDAWYNLKLAMDGTAITAFINGAQVAAVNDATLTSGQAALASNFYNVCFDNLRIKPIDSATPVSCLKINENHSAITYGGTWSNEDDSWQDWGRTIKKSNAAGATLQYAFSGSGVAVLGRLAANCGQAEVYLDNVKQAVVDTYSSSTCYRRPLYQKTDLSSGPHTLKLVVTGAGNSGASNTYIYVDGIESL
jgi:galactosylceramidase